MRDRHIFWDIAPLFMLCLITAILALNVYENERGWGVMQDIKKEQANLAAQNQKLLTAISEGISVRNSGDNGHGSTPSTNPNPNPNPTPAHPDVATTHPDETPKTERRPGMEHIPAWVKLPVVPKFVRGDENADDGDWLVETTGSEPNSLNPIRDNDASVSSFFGLANDSLCSRWDDLSVWEPRLAQAWTKELVCLAYAKDGKAKDLAQQIDKTWSADLKAKLQIKKISAENDDIVRIEISDVNNDYREALIKDFGARVQKQWWFYVSYEGQEFMDGKPITPKSMEAYLIDNLKKNPAFKGTIAPGWAGDDKVIVRVLGDEGARDAAEKILKEMTESPDNKGKVLDEKSASGKREQKLFNYDMFEDYIAQEKPVFTFYLRKDVKWHDGEPFSGKDIIFTYNTIMNPKIESGASRNYYQDCESVELVDNNPYVVRATWIRPYFDAFASSAGMDILPEHIFHFTDPKEFNEGPQNQKLIGTGSYKLEAWERGQRFVFVRNEQYYGRKPHFKRVIYQVVKDPTSQLQMFEKGDTDIYGLTPSQMEQRAKDPEFNSKFTIDRSTSNSYTYIGWNARNKLFEDKRVRQALTMLVDSNRICKDIMRGYAKPQYGTVHPDNPAYWKELPAHAWPFDVERAKKQLADAGWKDTDGDGVLDKDGVPFKFTLIIRSNSPEHEAIANLVKNSFAKAGIVVNVSNLEWSVLLQQIERLKFEAVVLGWRLGVAEDPYQLWHSSQIGEKQSNFCKFVSKDADRIIENARRELNDEKRYGMLEKFQQIVLDEQPYTFLYVPDRLVAYDKRIQNVKYKLIGADTDRWWVPLAKQKHKD